MSQFPPTEKRVPIGDVFTSCNWILRDGYGYIFWFDRSPANNSFSAPKTATKRIFLITNEDSPHSDAGSNQLTTSARTTLIVNL